MFDYREIDYWEQIVQLIYSTEYLYSDYESRLRLFKGTYYRWVLLIKGLLEYSNNRKLCNDGVELFKRSV